MADQNKYSLLGGESLAAAVPSIQEMHEAVGPAEDQRDEFDGASFLSDHGLTLQDVGDKAGSIHVKDSFGNSQEINLNEMMAKEGVNPQSVDLVLNNPTNAINKSPVGFGDRIRLALGNAKGQLNYLKANYQDAVLSSDGQLKVKDKGAWYNVDPRGLGDGSGWDMAKELVGDFADLTDVGISSLAQIGGATLSGLPSAGAGSLAGAAAGAALGKGITSALGRILGTYDATPEEQLRDVGMDAALGAVGQGIALGGKAAIVGTYNKAMQLFKGAEPNVQRMMAGVLEKSTGMSEQSALRSMERNDTVSPLVDRIVAKAKEPVSLTQTGSILDDVAVSSISAGSQEAIDQAAISESRVAAKALMENAQQRASNVYVGGMAEARALQGDAPLAASGPASEYMANLMDRLGGALKSSTPSAENPRISYSVDSNLLAQNLGMPPAQANVMAKKIAQVANGMQNVIHNTGETAGSTGFDVAVNAMKTQDDMYYSLVHGRPDLEQAFRGLGPKMKNDITASMTEGARNKFNSTNAWYADKKPSVEMASRALDSDGSGVDGAVKQLMARGGANLERKQQFDKLANLYRDNATTGESAAGGQAALNHLYDTLAAREVVGAFPREVVGGSLTRSAVKAGVNLAVGTSPIAQVGTAVKGLSLFGSTMRRMSEAQRKATLMDPAAFGALLGTAIGADR